MSASEEITDGIRVEVRAEYVPERSEPEQKRWFFAYHIRVTNESSRTVQLVSRRWIITDAHGRVEHVEGPGVLGQQPVLEPGGAHEYTSFCPLPTSFGTMAGSYQMRDDNGNLFDVVVGSFSLNEPFTVN
jgi:ApaG protein